MGYLKLVVKWFFVAIIAALLVAAAPIWGPFVLIFGTWAGIVWLWEWSNKPEVTR